MRESKAMQKVREVRAGLLTTQPFFGVLSLKLELIEDASIPTLNVNTSAMRFNPAFVETLSGSELKGSVAHEVMHLGLGHHARQGSRDHGMWETACDYAINPCLVADGITLPKGALFDKRFADKSAEEIYQVLADEKAQQQQAQPKPQQQPGGSQAQPSPGNGQGQPQPGPAGADPCPTGTFEAAGPDGSAPAQEAARQWQENANEAMRVASSAGKLPAGIKRIVQESTQPKADWRTLLRRFVSDQVKTRSTWSVPNKRFSDIYLPGRVRDGMGAMVVAVDTSGSISRPILDRFAAEIAAIAEDVEPACIHVVYCDARVNHVETFEQGEPVTLDAHGGGGTRFSPVFARVEEEGWNPACLVYLTDLDCSDWPAEPAYPVLWASTDKRRTAPMGETVHIS